jgi:hypothetical protein
MAAAKGSYLDAEDGITVGTIWISVEREAAVGDCPNGLGTKFETHGLASTTVSTKIEMTKLIGGANVHNIDGGDRGITLD